LLSSCTSSRVHVDDIEIRLHPGRHDAAIEKSHGARRVVRLALDEEAEIETPLGAVAAPMGQEIGHEVGIRDDADMRAAVAQPHDAILVRDHFAAGIEIVVGIVGER
jgi:hypothetical protein